MKYFVKSILGIGVALVTLSCNNQVAPETEANTNTSQPKETAEFVLLHEEKLSNGNVIEFYELDKEPGLLLTSESGIVGNEPSLPSISNPVEAFKAIKPNGAVPEVLSKAAARQEHFIASNKGADIVVEGPEIAVESSEPDEAGSTMALQKTAAGSCGRTWFEQNVCEDQIWGLYDQYQWYWSNAVSYSSKYLNNIKFGMKSSICGDIGTTLFKVRVRKSFSWKTTFSKDVLQGRYRTYWYSTGLNNHDFYSRGYPSTGARYHHCGGAWDY